MKVLSLNVGRPRRLETPQGPVLTSIWKSPVEGRVPLRRFNIEGDQQSDLRVHGGENKAFISIQWSITSTGVLSFPELRLRQACLVKT